MSQKSAEKVSLEHQILMLISFGLKCYFVDAHHCIPVYELPIVIRPWLSAVHVIQRRNSFD